MGSHTKNFVMKSFYFNTGFNWKHYGSDAFISSELLKIAAVV